MKILFVASEVAPFAKTGGLADVTGSLPKELKRLGHDVRIFLPFYREVEKSGVPVRKMRKAVEIPLGGEVFKGVLRQSSLDDIPVYLLENRAFFDRDGLYGTPAGDYPDNHRRFSFFCRGVLELLKRIDYRPDIIHCHDWQTALVPILLRYELSTDLFFARTAAVFTIHNLAYQGLFPRDALAEIGLDRSHFTIDRLEYYGRVNLMKGAILTADLVTTVSETYCREILTAEQGCGLEGVLQGRKDDLYGILNGLDYDEWDPETDTDIFKRYSPSSLAGKAANKKGLRRLLGLDERADVPLVGMVSRLVAQKGFDLVTELLPRFAGEDFQLAVLGTGDGDYVRLFEAARERGARNITLHAGFDPSLARKIYAGSDIFLMPSHFEPCGLGQLIALRYGAVPVARMTGGLADTVADSRGNPTGANGFTFVSYDADSLWETLQRAASAWRDREGWRRLMRRGMAMDFSWHRWAERYQELYRLGMAKKGV
jgi:starch synthase